MHRLHVMATMRLAHAALRGMVARGRGAVINVSSVAGFGQSPGSVSYCATKAWINSFTEGLRLELRGMGSPVKVQALCPGFTLSEFHDAMHMDRKRIPGWLWTRAEDVVDASLEGLAQGKLFVVPGEFYQLLVKLEMWMPQGLREALAIRYGKRTKRV
jgi:short-subunit dehydrogenase